MRTRLIFAAAFALVCLPLLLARADPVLLESLSAQRMLLESASASYVDSLALQEPPKDDLTALEMVMAKGASVLEIQWQLADDPEGTARLDALRAGGRTPVLSQVQADAGLGPWLKQLEASVFRLSWPDRSGGPTQYLRLEKDDQNGRISLVDISSDTEVTSAKLGSRWALLPPLVAILLAFLLRGTLIALTSGVLLGAAMLAWSSGSLWLTFRIAFVDILWDSIFTQTFNLYILGFVLLLSSTVAVITRMGGIDGMVNLLLRYAKNSRSVQTIAYALGLGIFFDDYANTIIVGNSCGPLFDRMKVSRAKLAYIVDSTAAPVAGIAILSTWVAYQISTFAPQLPTIGIPASQGYALFLKTVPYRFYCLFAMFMVGAVIWSKRDIGPMLRVEQEARLGHDPSTIAAFEGPSAQVEALPGVPARWFNGVLPLALMILGTAGLIYAFGVSAIQSKAADGDSQAIQELSSSGFYWLRAVLGASDSTAAIFFGSLSAFALAALMAMGQRLLSAQETALTACRGLTALIKDAVLILILAWSIGEVCTQLGTATYLVAAFQGMITGAWLPILLFLASCFVAFATGSSWTTMAIMQPNVVLLAYHLGEGTPFGPHGLLVLSIGAVLEGAIFGDHCSPISDTTILSSAASKCHHITHVRTQAPYAVITAFVAITLGYIPVALFNTGPWLPIIMGFVVLALIMRFAGKPNVHDAAAAKAA
jgi:Na+/H+ antiporter NhaC